MRIRLRLIACLLGVAACAPPRQLHPRLPGDHCTDDCPEGMRCWGTVRQRGGHLLTLGRCGLDAGRCLTDGDCGRAEQCVRPSAQVGLCGPAARL